jgi:hypothetical protein
MLVDIVIKSEDRLRTLVLIRQLDRANTPAGTFKISMGPHIGEEIAGKLKLMGVPDGFLPALKEQRIWFEVGNHGGRQTFVGHPLSR